MCSGSAAGQTPGVPAGRDLIPQKVIFLDRDGTINEEVHYLHRPEDLVLLPGAAEAIRTFREHGYRTVVVTNQAGVARGYYTEEDVCKLHAYMNELLKRGGAWIDDFFYCPHHPIHGIGPYKKECRCRKPGIGLFEQAEAQFPVDKAHSWMIGDKLLDIQAGRNYGVRTVLVGTGYGTEVHGEQLEKGEQPYDIFAETLMDAAGTIIGEEDSDETDQR